MPSDHRGRLLGGNYRSTPRLAKLLAKTMTMHVRDGYQEAARWYQETGDDYSALDYANRSVPEYPIQRAKSDIEGYRIKRDDRNYGKDREELEYFIRKAISERHQ